MAEIDVQRRNNMTWLWWLLGLLALALIIWAVASAGDDDEVAMEPAFETPVVTPTTTPEPVAQLPGITIADILGDPAGFIGETWEANSVQVMEVPSDRGFWVEDQGQRLFAIVIDQPQEQPVDINPGQTIRITEGVLRDRTFLPQIPGDPLEANTQSIAEGQPIFLTVNEENIEILEQGTPQPGTDPAMVPGAQ